MNKEEKNKDVSYGLFYLSMVPGLIFCAVISYNSPWFAAINTIWFGGWLLLFAHILTDLKQEVEEDEQRRRN